MKKWVPVFIALVVFVALLPVLGDGEHLDLDAAARATAPVDFMELGPGEVAYQLSGPEGGRPVVLVAGYSIDMSSFDVTASALAAAGFRVLRYDHYGRGWSDRPPLRYGPDLYQQQLLSLLDAVGFRGPVDLVAVSMGGAVAARFTVLDPARVRRLVLVSPYGLPQDLPLMARLIRVPWLGEYLMALAGDSILKKRLPGNVVRARDAQQMERRFAAQMEYRGYKRALLSTMRHFMTLDCTSLYEDLGRLDTPVLLLWGTEDAVVPYAFADRIQAAVPQARFLPLPGLGHNPFLESDDQVTPRVLEFLTAP